MQKEEKSLVTYESNPYPHEILHIKCYVIKFIREQMENIRGRKPPPKKKTPADKALPEVSEKQHTESKANRESNSECKPWGWLQWLLLYLLLLIMFLYGAIIGSNFCQTRRYSCHPLYPLIGFGRKGREVIF